ncbi:VTT domain-containing protein [Schnuerera sp. xch1]|uniref:TVP38/TMEM64 family protein n=1 Tax=Schnuerera sp. xch1 TaxID=2874283 RepID=UPI001CBC7398|nr:VTT domain-containing protein [Schnuerera sp. xch1]MBZ2174379.1 VTT domain-containing protein [Schnuerera sp. xch1]
MESTRRTKKSYIYLTILLSAAVLYIAYEPFKAFSSETVMLFTSKSSESIIGYLNSYDIIRPAVSIALMLLQALIFPFKYEIMIFANIKVFGELIGLGLSLIGRIIGAYICYDIGKTLLSNRIELIIKKLNISEITTNYMRSSGLVHVFIRILPLNFDLISYVAGIIQLDSKKYMLNSIVWIILTTVSYSIKKGYYSYSYEMRTTFIRLILSILVFVIIAKRYHKDIGRV